MKSEQVTKSQLVSNSEIDEDGTSCSNFSLFCEEMLSPIRMLDIFNVFEEKEINSKKAEENT